LSGWRSSRGAVAGAARVCGAGLAAAAALAACGGVVKPSVTPHASYFPVQVSRASFPASQRLAELTHLVIEVRNAGHVTIPNIAVTITDPPYGTAAAAFGALIQPQPGLASRSRPVWVVNRPPQPPSDPCGYSCAQGGLGGGVTAYSNTWALGRLAPGQTYRFDWALTAVQPGTYRVHYRVAAGLDGNYLAVMPGGGRRPVQGTFHVTILKPPLQGHVTGSGSVTYSR
jgi:hypothetical protein